MLCSVKNNKVYLYALMWFPRGVGFDLEADVNLRFKKKVYCHYIYKFIIQVYVYVNSIL